MSSYPNEDKHIIHSGFKITKKLRDGIINQINYWKSQKSFLITKPFRTRYEVKNGLSGSSSRHLIYKYRYPRNYSSAFSGVPGRVYKITLGKPSVDFSAILVFTMEFTDMYMNAVIEQKPKEGEDTAWVQKLGTAIDVSTSNEQIKFLERRFEINTADWKKNESIDYSGDQDFCLNIDSVSGECTITSITWELRNVAN